MTYDFRESKIKILSEEHSRAFQEVLFEVGAGWCGSGKLYKQNLKFIYVNECLLMTHSGSPELFEEHVYKEIQFPPPTKGHPHAKLMMRYAKGFLELVYEPEKKGHVHSELMAQYAEDAKTHTEPWKLWQIKVDGRFWRDCEYSPSWGISTEYRRKPKTHIVHGVEIPDLRIKEEPKPDTMVVCVNPLERSLFSVRRWTSDGMYLGDYQRFLKLGFLYEYTVEGQEAAILHTKAMMGMA